MSRTHLYPIEAEASSEDPDFPPIRIGNDPLFAHARYPHAAARASQQLAVSNGEGPCQPRCRRQPITGLGTTNILNTADANGPVSYSEGDHSPQAKFSLKRRDLVAEDHENKPPPKKQRRTLRDDNTVRCLQRQVVDIKESLYEMTVEVREERRELHYLLAHEEFDAAGIKGSLEEMAGEIEGIKESLEEVVAEVREEKEDLKNLLEDFLSEIRQ